MVDEAGRPIVLVTGVTGFLGSTVGRKLLKHKPEWKVRGMVRQLDNEGKIEGLKRAWGDKFDDVELVQGDLLDAESIKLAVEGATYVIHCATNVPTVEPKDPQTVIRPAVDGSMNILRASKEFGVKRVAMTSSIVTTMGVDLNDAPDVFTEQCWSDIDKLADAYSKGKTMAERAAWEYVCAMPEDERLELVTLLPGIILGPTEVNKGFAVGSLIEAFLLDKFPGGVPRIHNGVVDVRDCAMAHIRALEREEARGKRFIVACGSIWMREVGAILQEKYGPVGYKVPTKESKYCWIKFFSYFRRDVVWIAKYWGFEFIFNNSRSREILGIDYRPIKVTLHDMVESMIKNGHIIPPPNPQPIAASD